jgi:hypothetical protein
LLQAAVMGVAFEGKSLLLAEVAIQLNYTDLRGLLYLQDDKDSDFGANRIQEFKLSHSNRKGPIPAPFF